MYKINFDMVFNSHFLDEKDNTLLYDRKHKKTQNFQFSQKIFKNPASKA